MKKQSFNFNCTHIFENGVQLTDEEFNKGCTVDMTDNLSILNELMFYLTGEYLHIKTKASRQKQIIKQREEYI